ncbi:hypothetical protein FACS1894105_05670 [Clostridia bacterium]|nr:hypothetical protein FACS1894105_05670 [Clostridia bacterium]
MTKTLVSMLVSLALILNFGAMTGFSADDTAIKVKIDGQTVSFEAAPFIENGRTMVPFRAIFEKLGFTVDYLEYAHAIDARKESGTHVISAYICLKRGTIFGDSDISVSVRKNGSSNADLSFAFDFEAAPAVKDGHTFIPARAVSESLGFNVDWDGKTRTVIIGTFNQMITPPASAAILSGTTSAFDVKADKFITASSPAVSVPAIDVSKIDTSKKLTIDEITALEDEVIRLGNAERAKSGIAPLEKDENLSKVARFKAQDMVNNKYFSHVSPKYGTNAELYKHVTGKAGGMGENIAGGYSPEEVMKAWMDSPGHKANILNKEYTKIGVGSAQKLDWVMYSQMFMIG